MPVFTKANFKINLGIASIGGELTDDDRQCAWELYCELVSRVALVGKLDEHGKQVFVGERYDQSLDSLCAFVKEARGLMRRYPVGRLAAGGPQNHLGFFIASLLEIVLRPFLEKWRASYRHWWEQAHTQRPDGSPFELQETYPRLAEMQQDWIALRRFCREAARELTHTFSLPDVTAVAPPQFGQAWLDETAAVIRASSDA